MSKSLGCDEGQYCKFIGPGIDHYDNYMCKPTEQNGRHCDADIDCTSKMCTKYTHKRNKCYGCIADYSNTKYFGRERTRHCTSD